MQYHELRGVMIECDVEVERDPEQVEPLRRSRCSSATPAGPRPGDPPRWWPQQAQKRVGLRFVPSRMVSWDHRKLGGVY